METKIQQGQSFITMVNVFTVGPENQQQLVNILTKATDEVMVWIPGLISANLHSIRVVNYTQWESKAAFKAMFGFAAVKEHMNGADKIATAGYPIYEVAHVRHA